MDLNSHVYTGQCRSRGPTHAVVTDGRAGVSVSARLRTLTTAKRDRRARERRQATRLRKIVAAGLVPVLVAAASVALVGGPEGGAGSRPDWLADLEAAPDRTENVPWQG